MYFENAKRFGALKLARLCFVLWGMRLAPFCLFVFLFLSFEPTESINGRPPKQLRFSIASTGAFGSPNTSIAYGPGQVSSFYNWPWPSKGGSGKTLGIVIAYHSPTVENDLATFSQAFGLPACTTANGCFSRVNQTGGSTAPPVYEYGDSWAFEATLDCQWAHSIAPYANILLVETLSDSLSDFASGVAYARQHADAVSMSWIFSETSDQTNYDQVFDDNDGFPFFGCSGDVGAVVSWPSTNPNVVAVGGTTIDYDEGTVLESGWISSGGGCSRYEQGGSAQQANPSFQQSTGPSRCGQYRTTPDVSMIAANVWVYSTWGCISPPSCWYISGGTSLGAPIYAALSAVVSFPVNPATIYNTQQITFRDIVNGSAISPDGINKCAKGFDLVTGLGSWLF